MASNVSDVGAAVLCPPVALPTSGAGHALFMASTSSHARRYANPERRAASDSEPQASICSSRSMPASVRIGFPAVSTQSRPLSNKIGDDLWRAIVQSTSVTSVETMTSVALMMAVAEFPFSSFNRFTDDALIRNNLVPADVDDDLAHHRTALNRHNVALELISCAECRKRIVPDVGKAPVANSMTAALTVSRCRSRLMNVAAHLNRSNRYPPPMNFSTIRAVIRTKVATLMKKLKKLQSLLAILDGGSAPSPN